MIEYRKGDILSVTEGVIAHGVNCQGVMGAGLAKAIKDKYPIVYQRYKNYCTPVVLYETRNRLGNTQFALCQEYASQIGPLLVIANCFTQDYYGRDKRYVDYEAVAQCFTVLDKRVQMYTDKPLNIPKIGAGLAGGDWNVISAIIESEYKGDVICWEL